MKLSRKLFNLTFAATGMLAQTASALITIETVPVGNAGSVGNSSYGSGGNGGVGYDYGIGKYEVTINQYTAFLNSVAVTDAHGLYNTEMGSNPNIMGISRSGVSGSYSYSVIGSGLRPVTYVSWYDSARFVNWLHNGQPVGLQTAGTTETGAYTLTESTVFIARNSGATYCLPNWNEWYKAAYHQPTAQGGDVDDYWLYPTQSNTKPNSSNGSGTDPNSANFNFATGGLGGYLTDVGSFSLADSFYGTFDQGGNVWEFIDDGVAENESTHLLGHGIRGGAWSYNWEPGQPALAGYGYPYVLNPGVHGESQSVGFRVVIVPEPTIAGLMGLGALLMTRKRK